MHTIIGFTNLFHFFMRSLLGAIAAISVISSPALARFDTPAFVKCSFNGVMERCKVGFDTDGSFYVEWLKDGHWTVYRFILFQEFSCCHEQDRRQLRKGQFFVDKRCVYCKY